MPSATKATGWSCCCRLGSKARRQVRLQVFKLRDVPE
jgi:hypothetical protein